MTSRIDHESDPSDDQLKQLFIETIDKLALPTVDPEAGVAHELDRNVVEVSPGRRVLVAAAVAVVVTTTATVLVLTPAGEAVASWFGIGATVVEIEPSTHTTETPSQPTPEPTPSQDLVSGDADAVTETLGEKVESEANPLPDFGEPEVFDHPSLGRSYFWPSPPKGEPTTLLLSARRDDGLLAVKTVAGEEMVEMVTVESIDTPALWIAEPHLLRFDGPTGDSGLRSDTYLSGPVLIWVDEGIQYRLEGAGVLERALALAAMAETGTKLLPGE